MKIGIIAMVCLLAVIPIVFGAHGGDTLNYSIDRCEKYNVTITPCDIGEWKIEGCNETATGFWMCNCTDNYILNMTPAQNSIGNFTIKIDYTYLSNEIPYVGTSYYYGGGITTYQTVTCTENWNCSDWSSCVNGKQSRICTDLNNCNTTISKPVGVQTCSIPPVTINETTPKANETNTGTNQTKTTVPTGFAVLTPYINNPITISLIIVIILAIVAWILYKKKMLIFKKKIQIKEDQIKENQE